MCPPVVGSLNLFHVGKRGMCFEMVRIRPTGMRMGDVSAGRTHGSAPTGKSFGCADLIGVVRMGCVGNGLDCTVL